MWSLVVAYGFGWHENFDFKAFVFPQNPLDVQGDKLLLFFVLPSRVHIVEDVLQLQHQSSNELLFASCIKRVTCFKGANGSPRMDPCDVASYWSWYLIATIWAAISRRCIVSLLSFGSFGLNFLPLFMCKITRTSRGSQKGASLLCIGWNFTFKWWL